MKKLILALAIALSWARASAQTVSFYSDRAIAANPFSVNGVKNLMLVIPNGQVRVCTYSAPVPGGQCSPLASIFDTSGNAISNSIGGNFGQLTTDSVGRFAFGCSSGTSYIVQIAAAFNNTPSLSYAVTCSGNINNILSGNNTWTGTNTFSGTTTFSGTVTSSGGSLTGSWAGNPTFTGNISFTGTNTHSGVETFQNINNTLYVGGTNGYTSMQACLNALPSTGGTCLVVPNYSETLSATLTLKAYSTIQFLGPCTITMGTNPVVLPAGVNGAWIIGPAGGGVHGANPCKWVYTGTGGAFQMGASTGDTTGMNLSNLVTDISGANSAADGFVFKRIIYSEGHNLEALGIAGAGSTQIAFLFDGTNNYTGDDEWYNLRGGLWKMIALTNGSNVNHFHTVSSEGGLQGTAGICIDFTTNSSSNTLEGVDCENGANMLHFGNTATGNTVRGVFDQGNTNSVTFDVGSSDNFVDDTSTVAGTFVDNGTDNYINRGSNRGTSTFFGGCSGTFPSSVTSTYMAPGTTSCTAGSVTALFGPFPHKLTVRNLTVACGTGGSTAGSGAVTLLSGGASKPLTCTTGTGSTCSDTNEAHAFSVSKGGNIQVQVVTGAAETLANCSVSFDTQ